MTAVETAETILTLLKPEHGEICSMSYHPHDNPCTQPAAYIVEVECTQCELRRRPVCTAHASAMFRNYVLDGVWCECSSSEHDETHKIISTVILPL